ncbi:MAG TPA: ribosome rescue GTPase HflX [Xanthomonadales bacterium]|nr:ribosome rescue GTPase HflX [Xanthomonadales bacterium]
MIERAERGNRAVILHPQFRTTGPESLEEFRELALSAGVNIVDIVVAPRDRPGAKYFVGSGKVEELVDTVKQRGADVVLVSESLSAVQQRNLEKRCEVQVLDRATVILDIFAQRAKSYEGKLQVELAQLRHLSTRLVRGWTHLERQKGGIGLRGPGETQLETDRRLIGKRIRQLGLRLEKVGKQRDQSRRQRKRSGAPLLALVGYTNAGKSTLFNQLTEAEVHANDRLFDTLDPTVRKVEGMHCGDVLLADTVGFVSDLPHELVAAFRSTLQEARDADVLLHVIDASDPYRMERQAEVDEVLEAIGADDISVIRVYNKVDLTDLPVEKICSEDGKTTGVRLSARDGEGLDILREVIAGELARDHIQTWIELAGEDARFRAQLFELGVVSEERIANNGSWKLQVDVPRKTAVKLASQPGKTGQTARELLFDQTPI